MISKLFAELFLFSNFADHYNDGVEYTYDTCSPSASTFCAFTGAQKATAP